jgi:AGZA family xanthine/uracil permease-like MFS transporter
MPGLNALFAFDRHHTTPGREIIAGLTTFTTMSYIVVVNPAILSAAGTPKGPSLLQVFSAFRQSVHRLFFIFYPYS